MDSSNAVAERKADPALALTKGLESSVSNALPAHITKEQFSRAFLTALRKTPALVQCSQTSIATAVVTAAQLGLMIDINGAAWLIPFGKECQLIIGYQGLVDLCYRSGLVESIFADVVCENDNFTYQQGLEQQLDHKPNLIGERGKPYAVYALARIKESRTPVYVVLNRGEVMDVKKASRAASSKSSPWNGAFEAEMWKKTAIRRLCKLLPKSVELVRAMDFESKQEERWAQADVVDDPFAPGRKSLKSPAPEPATKTPTVTGEPASDYAKAYAKLSLLYDERSSDIDAAMSRHGLGMELPDVPRETDDPAIIQAVVAVAEKVGEKL